MNSSWWLKTTHDDYLALRSLGKFWGVSPNFGMYFFVSLCLLLNIHSLLQMIRDALNLWWTRNENEKALLPWKIDLSWTSIRRTLVQTDILPDPLDVFPHPSMSTYWVWGAMLGTHRNTRERGMGIPTCHFRAAGSESTSINIHSFWNWKK